MEKYEDEYELERVKVELNMAVDELLKLRAENKRWQEILRSPRPRGVLPWNGHNYRCPKCGSHDALFWNFKIICSPCHYGGQDIEAIDCRIEEIDRLRDAAVGYAEAAEYWRMKYHRERIFTSTCCRRSLSGQLLHKLLETREPITRHVIKHLLHDVMDGSRFQPYLEDYVSLLEMIRASRVAPAPSYESPGYCGVECAYCGFKTMHHDEMAQHINKQHPNAPGINDGKSGGDIRRCPICNGIGCIDDGQESMRNLRETCPACDGSGRVVYDEDGYYESCKKKEVSE